MQHVTVAIPDERAAALASPGQDLSRSAFVLKHSVRDFAAVLPRVQAGDEVIIERDGQPVAIVSPAERPIGRLLSESMALAEAHASTAVMDGDFAKDVQDAIESHREPLNPPEWD
jgi:antitoxin (DNA-binding transcriptional repressor) of toxin-antitoxin stability system